MNTHDGGTPAEPKPVTGDGGTGAGAGDGTGGRSPTKEDLQALEQKHRENLEKERAARSAAETRIAQLEARVMAATAPPADPRLQRIRDLQERQGYDDNAAAILDLTTEVTVAQLENRLLQEIVALGIPREAIGTVQQLVRNSNYNMSTADAVRMARGTTVDAVEAERKKLAEELDKTKKELEAVKTRVPNMAMTPAVAIDPSAGSVAASTYNAILDKGGPEARAIMARTRIPKGEPGHLNIEFGT